uniref:Reverse transcriptase domain-containing protein n=1 Tax=Tanacetum cinerariifolium TaxID=118510 RepID=A0A699HHN9_TANCI|nr:reverse transcriptase domain-containing protein [Tanacetum cinerariifolium]
MTLEEIKELIIQRVAEALAIKEANRNLRPIIEGESENRDDNGKGNGGGNENGNGGGNKNGNDGGNGNGNDGGNKNNGNNNRNGNRVVRLARWFKKMELVFHISNCTEDSQVKFSIYTLLDGALIWWDLHVKTIAIGEAYEMSRKE